MQISELRKRTADALVVFAWNQWAQMGVLAEARRHDVWAQDPEALLVFTVQIARREPRLFDEVLDWLRRNGALVSGRRLSRLSQYDNARALVQACVEWAAAHGSPLRISARLEAGAASPAPLFPALRAPSRLDETFRRYGFLKAPTEPTLKSTPPDLELPINLAFRLRAHFGVGSRAEIVRFLLTSGVPWANTLAIAQAAVSVKRNVNDTLTDLVAAGELTRHTVGNEARYSIDRTRWAVFLGLNVDELPRHRDWPHLLWALREIDRWLGDPRSEELDDYLRASEARVLLDRVGDALAQAGVPVSSRGLAEEYWPSFVATVDAALETLRP